MSPNVERKVHPMLNLKCERMTAKMFEHLRECYEMFYNVEKCWEKFM